MLIKFVVLCMYKKMTTFAHIKKKFKNMEELPPPHDYDVNGLPSYFRGYLYYYDGESDNTMRWVLYDGQNRVRYASRTALENDIIRRQQQTPQKAVELLMRAHARAERAYQDLDAAAAMLDANSKVIAESHAVNLRKLTDMIDTLIAQIIKRR